MADDTNSEFRIRISTPADVSGADTAQAALEGLAKSGSGVEAAGERGAKGIARILEEAGTVREAQRIAQGFFDIFLGGGRTIEGTAEIMRFFIATAADLNPVFAALSVVGASIAVVAGRQAEHNTKMQEGASGADAFAESVEKAQTRVRAAYELTDKQNANLDDVAKQQAEAAERQATALEKSLNFQKQLNEEKLRGAEQDALINNKDGPAGVLAIQQRFDAMRRGNDERAQLQKIEIDRNVAEGQQYNVRGQITRKQGEIDAGENAISTLSANRDQAVAAARAWGYSVDEKGTPEQQAKAWQETQKGTGEAMSRAADAYNDAQARLENLRKMSAAGRWLLDPHGDVERAEEQDVAQKGAAFNEASWRDRTVANATRAQAAYADTDTGVLAQQEKLDKNSQALADLDSKMGELNTTLGNLNLQEQDVKTKASNDAADAQRKAAQDLLTQQNKDFDAKNKTQIEAQEKIASNPDQYLSDREWATLQAAALRNAGIQRTIDQGTAQGAQHPISSDEAQALRDQIKENQAEAERKNRDLRDSALGVSAENKPEYDTATHPLQQLVARASSIVYAGGNTAAQDQLTAQMGDLRGSAGFLAQYFNGSSNGDESLLSQQIARVLADQTAALPQQGSRGAANQSAYDVDALNTGLNQATDAAAAAHLKLPGTVGKAVDLMGRAVAVAEALKDSTDPKLIAIGQRLDRLEGAVKSSRNTHN